jgi:hypothetical protein
MLHKQVNIKVTDIKMLVIVPNLHMHYQIHESMIVTLGIEILTMLLN